MKLKKILAVMLSAATLAGTLPALSGTQASAAASASAFPDIEDPTVAEAAEFLRLLGILGGMDDGTYQPNQPLTRA